MNEKIIHMPKISFEDLSKKSTTELNEILGDCRNLLYVAQQEKNALISAIMQTQHLTEQEKK